MKSSSTTEKKEGHCDAHARSHIAEKSQIWPKLTNVVALKRNTYFISDKVAEHLNLPQVTFRIRKNPIWRSALIRLELCFWYSKTGKSCLAR